jgi:hypothetical protein
LGAGLRREAAARLRVRFTGAAGVSAAAFSASAAVEVRARPRPPRVPRRRGFFAPPPSPPASGAGNGVLDCLEMDGLPDFGPEGGSSALMATPDLFRIALPGRNWRRRCVVLLWFPSHATYVLFRREIGPDMHGSVAEWAVQSKARGWDSAADLRVTACAHRVCRWAATRRIWSYGTVSLSAMKIGLRRSVPTCRIA